MSHSLRKTPIVGNRRCRSERSDKKRWHARLRVAERTRLRTAPDFDSVVPVSVHEVSSPEAMAKQGKHYVDRESQVALKWEQGPRNLLHVHVK